MGDWADINQESDPLKDKIEGFAEELLTNRESRQFDDKLVTEERVEAAKGLVRRKVFAHDGLSGQVDRYNSPELFLDAFASDPDLKSQVIEAIAYAFLHVFASSNRISGGGRLAEQSAGFEEDVDEQIDALAATAPFVLGWSDTTGSFSGGSVKSTFDRYG